MMIQAFRTRNLLPWAVFAIFFLMVAYILFFRLFDIQPGLSENDYLLVVALAPIVWLSATLLLSRINYENGLRKENQRAHFFLDLLTHDVANASTPVTAYLEMLLNSNRIGDDEKGMLRKSHAEMEKMNTIIYRVRELSIDNLERINERVVLDIRSILDISVARLKVSHPSIKFDITIEDRASGKRRVIAGKLMDEVFLTVMQNALREHHPEESKMKIEIASIDAGRFEVAFTDYGNGIPDERKKLIFIPSNGLIMRKSFGGIYLDLAICRRLLEMHGGSIRVEDRIPGDHARGARIIISLLQTFEDG